MKTKAETESNTITAYLTSTTGTLPLCFVSLRLLQCCFTLFLLFFLFTKQITAQESWGAALFTTQRHDFGSVPLGTNAEFRFELKNVYNSDLRLLSVRSSCSCVSARLSATLLKPGETGAVIARLNTSGQHLRKNSSVLTLQIQTMVSGSRRTDTVQLFVSGFIRPDVVLTPGIVEFGAVAKGTAAERTVMLEYTGNPGWALMSVQRSQPFIYARAEEVRRQQGNIAYRITAILQDDAPADYVRDVLRFTTNESQSGRAVPVEILLPVQGVVRDPLQAKPSPIMLGILSPEESVTKNVVIRSETPFRIMSVSARDARFRFAFSDQESTVQMVSVSFASSISSGRTQDIADVIRITTNDPRQPGISVNAFVRVVPKY